MMQFIFRKRYEKNIYEFGLMMDGEVYPYAVVNVETNAYYIPLSHFSDPIIKDVANRLEREGRTKGLSTEEASRLIREEADKEAINQLLDEAKRVDEVFSDE